VQLVAGKEKTQDSLLRITDQERFYLVQLSWVIANQFTKGQCG
jgi:hypothetical protein